MRPCSAGKSTVNIKILLRSMQQIKLLTEILAKMLHEEDGVAEDDSIVCIISDLIGTTNNPLSIAP
jgi:hypothetical protein